MPSKEFNFIKRTIDALPLPEGKNGRERYYDNVMRGLCIRLTANGRKSFYFYRKIQGRVVSQKIGDYPHKTIEQARGAAAELNGRIAKGEKPWELSAQAKAEMTLEKLFEAYMERHAKKVRKTSGAMEKAFDRYAVTIRKHKLSEISSTVAEKLHGKIAQERGTYAANRAVQLLRSIYNKGIKWKLYNGSNPFSSISLFKEKPRSRFLSMQEAGRLLQSLNQPTEDENEKNLYDFIKLSLFTGVRKSNLANLRWKDIDFDNATLTIPDTKNDTTQIIALGNYELEVLKRRHKTTSSIFVFPGPGKTGHLITNKKSWATLRKKLGIEDVTIHDLRRSLGSALANANVSTTLVKSILNHTDVKTTMNVYSVVGKDTERQARVAVQKAWLAAAEREKTKLIALKQKAN